MDKAGTLGGGGGEELRNPRQTQWTSEETSPQQFRRVLVDKAEALSGGGGKNLRIPRQTQRTSYLMEGGHVT